MNGSWFWWGATGYDIDDKERASLFKRLWQNLFRYFTDTNALNNVLWVYSPDAGPHDKTAYYPGDEYVDYSQTPETLEGYDAMVGLGKVFAFTKVGPSTLDGRFDYAYLVDVILTRYPKAAYFMSWNSFLGPTRNKNAAACYNHAGVINREACMP